MGDNHLDPSSSPLIENALDPVLYELFCTELEAQCKLLTHGVIAVENKPENRAEFESLMRAAHSIKGAARVVNIQLISILAHSMEDFFSAALKKSSPLSHERADLILKGVDFLEKLSKTALKEADKWLQNNVSLIQSLIQEMKESDGRQQKPPFQKAEENVSSSSESKNKAAGWEDSHTLQTADRVLRITARNLNRLMGLAGESVIESRWLHPFELNLQQFKKNIQTTASALEALKERLELGKLSESAKHCLADMNREIHALRDHFSERMTELDSFIYRFENLSDRLYQEVIDSRMRPFSDGVSGFPRMVRDLARALGKNVRLEIEGRSTSVDREILEKLEVPLTHLLRNAVDHGIESPSERESAGKKAEGVISLEARHLGGFLAIAVSDDGSGINVQKLGRNIVEKRYATQEEVDRLSEAELIDFLFLPGFSTSTTLSEISGRGVGLNIVRTFIEEVGGTIQIENRPGQGLTFHLQLPLTLSVVRTLLVDISGEVYAFPLARIDHTILVKKSEIQWEGNRSWFSYEGQKIWLVEAAEILELEKSVSSFQFLSVIILREQANHYGLIVDRLIGEKALVVHELDARLGKISGIHACAIMENGSPVLIIDIEELIQSIDRFFQLKDPAGKGRQNQVLKKRILVVDDSMTFREMESRVLKKQGYEIETAINGLDGWNALLTKKYDLVISDVEMPGLNGIEFVKALKNDPHFKHLPVIIISFREKEEDLLKGMAAGADQYLGKSSLKEEKLAEAVKALIDNDRG